MLRELLKLKDDLEKTSKQRLITDLRDDSQKRTSYVDVVKKDRAINYSILPVKKQSMDTETYNERKASPVQAQQFLVKKKKMKYSKKISVTFG